MGGAEIAARVLGVQAGVVAGCAVLVGTGFGSALAKLGAQLLCPTHSAVPSLHACSMPPTPLLPPGTRFLPGERSSVPAWYTPSGHILVRPTVNGREAGYFIFDTGAGGAEDVQVQGTLWVVSCMAEGQQQQQQEVQQRRQQG